MVPSWARCHDDFEELTPTEADARSPARITAPASKESEKVMTKVLIAVDGSERSEDAVAFGRVLALAAAAPVILATADRSDPLRPGAHAHDAFLREEANAKLVRLAAALDDVDAVELRPLVTNTSAAQALQDLAEREGAGIIVVGSSHTGRLGRVLPGSTAERLLHGAPCPVAVVPLGYRTHATLAHPVVGCAYRSTEDGAAALGAAEELALALSGSLRVMQIIEPLARIYDSGEMPLNFPEISASIYADTERGLMERAARLSSKLESEATLHSGKPVEVLIGLSETVDILVMGSRGYGAFKAVLLGGVSGQVIRSAACPVIVVPHQAATAVGSVFAAAA